MKKIIPENAVLVPEEAKKVFKGIIYDVYQWQQKMFDGTSWTFEMLKRTDTVQTICVVDDKILVIDDEQPHTGNRKSFPGGRVDKGEDTFTAAKREVHEETGYNFKNWRLIKVWQPHTKMEWFIYLYLAWDGVKDSEPHLDAGEKITVNLVSFDEIQKLVFDKAGFLSETIDTFEAAGNLEGLLKLPEFNGREVDR